MEVWKDVVGYEGLYQVSNYGKIRSVDRLVAHNNGGEQFIKGKNKKIQIRDKDGYGQVNLYKDGKYKTLKVHRIVAEAFLGKCDENLQINHKDWDRKNNKIENLEWCTAKYNVEHRRSPLVVNRAKRWYGPIRERKIVQKQIDGEIKKYYPSAASAAKENGFDSSSITKAARKKMRTYKGYIWEYA